MRQSSIQSRRDPFSENVSPPRPHSYTASDTSPIRTEAALLANNRIKKYQVKGDTWKRPVLGSVLLSLTRRPSRWELERDARGQRKETRRGQKPNRNPKGQGRRTSDPEPGKPRHRQARTGRRQNTRAETHFAFEECRFFGRRPFVRFWGRRPEGSATEPSRAALLNPPPFECPAGQLVHTTVVQRRASRERFGR